MGFGFGNIGWVPLAPYEVFHPWWGRGYYGRPGYINRNMNIANGSITNVYRNSRYMNGVTAVRGADFQAGRFGIVSHFTGNQIHDASVVRGGMPIAPGAAHLRFSDRAVANAPRTSANTRFFTRQQPSSAAERIPFAQQQRAFEQAGMPVRGGVAGMMPGARGGGATGAAQQPAGGSLRPAVNQPGRAAAPGQNTRPTVSPAQASSQNRGGWERFGDPGARTAQPTPAASAGRATAQQPADRGWSRFGNPQVSPPQQQAPQPQPQYRNAPAPSNRAPSYSAPRYSAPAPSAPRPSAPSYSAPRSAPAAPSHSGGGGGGGGSRGSGRR